MNNGCEELQLLDLVEIADADRLLFPGNRAGEISEEGNVLIERFGWGA